MPPDALRLQFGQHENLDIMHSNPILPELFKLRANGLDEIVKTIRTRRSLSL